MALNFNPILHFQKTQKDAAQELYKAVRSTWLTAALNGALAEMSFGNATSEQMQGARNFVRIFINMAEDVATPPPSLPSKELGQKPLQTEKKEQ